MTKAESAQLRARLHRPDWKHRPDVLAALDVPVRADYADSQLLYDNFIADSWAADVPWFNGDRGRALATLLLDAPGALTAYTLAHEVAARYARIVGAAPLPVHLWSLKASFSSKASRELDHEQDEMMRVRDSVLPRREVGPLRRVSFAMPLLSEALCRSTNTSTMPVNLPPLFLNEVPFSLLYDAVRHVRPNISLNVSATPFGRDQARTIELDLRECSNPFGPVVDILKLGYSLHQCGPSRSNAYHPNNGEMPRATNRFLLAIPPAPLYAILSPL